MKQNTHRSIHPDWVGVVDDLAEGASRVSLRAIPGMAADDRGLVHGGFTFGLADYAAMVAVNDPNVVLGAAEVKFTAPVRVGQSMVAEARVEQAAGKRRDVRVSVIAEGALVFEGKFAAFVPERHILER